MILARAGCFFCFGGLRFDGLFFLVRGLSFFSFDCLFCFEIFLFRGLEIFEAAFSRLFRLEDSATLVMCPGAWVEWSRLKLIHSHQGLHLVELR